MAGASALAVTPGPYAVADLLAMPEDGQRYELIDGDLHLPPVPAGRHQLAAGRLCTFFAAALADEWEAVEAIDVQCTPGTILQPDVVVVAATALSGCTRVFKVSDVALVVEIVSPSSVRMDRLLKPQVYADAGIDNYLLVDLDGPTVTWFGLAGDGGYAVRSVAAGEEPLELPAPLAVSIIPARLVGPRG
ncbi:MAG TPA: Uma2 family endonuclease [Mycobacteriales bacterium]|nr:Uma2 family endonuclease [Mycobacteriales bacterium]